MCENITLQVKGQNKLFKEIEETTAVEDKALISDALHRNERTFEVEGFDQDHLNSTDYSIMDTREI